MDSDVAMSSWSRRRDDHHDYSPNVGVSIPPVGLCFRFIRLIGCGLIFATGVLYGLMSLGKKTDRQTMMARAADDKVILVPGTNSK